MVDPPPELMDMALVPSILHIPSHVFYQYPPAYKDRMRKMVLKLIAAGWAGNTDVIKAR